MFEVLFSWLTHLLNESHRIVFTIHSLKFIFFIRWIIERDVLFSENKKRQAIWGCHSKNRRWEGFWGLQFFGRIFCRTMKFKSNRWLFWSPHLLYVESKKRAGIIFQTLWKSKFMKFENKPELLKVFNITSNSPYQNLCQSSSANHHDNSFESFQ